MFKTPSQKPLQNNQLWKTKKSKPSKCDFFKTWRLKRKILLYIMIQISLFLQFNDILKIVVYYFKIKVLF